ncbi:alpha/beta hydrolase [Lacimicrobium alkaliphilum]|uniref:Acetylhydrolase n=1 Tax=Lacimicrobium alkaliphilum TaxID=1526571 RepID=A0ABQ1RCP9_9ALTE|nr:alpha/beta hydrolase [Lacimicrobium alkaliphilum]GGD66044.1 acetylhydrolase [Lacimicrobium alkaliphilum]
MIDKDTQALLAQFNQQTPDIQQPEADAENVILSARDGARAMFLNLAGIIDSDCQVKELNINGPTQSITARLYRPALTTQKNMPLVMFLHGGGWSLGDLDCYDGLIRELCSLSGCLFISVDYRLAPEHKYPKGLNDATDAMEWIFSNAKQLGADSKRIAIMGDSAGANLAIAVSHRLHSKTSIRLTAMYLIYPVMDVHNPHKTYPSRITYGNGDYLLSRDAIDGTRDWYLDENSRSDNPEVSPVFLSKLSHLPATSIITAGLDPLQDEGKEFANRLREDGVLSRYHCEEGTIHAFLSFGVLPVARQTRALLAKQLQEDLDNS